MTDHLARNITVLRCFRNAGVIALLGFFSVIPHARASTCTEAAKTSHECCLDPERCLTSKAVSLREQISALQSAQRSTIGQSAGMGLNNTVTNATHVESMQKSILSLQGEVNLELANACAHHAKDCIRACGRRNHKLLKQCQRGEEQAEQMRLQVETSAKASATAGPSGSSAAP